MRITLKNAAMRTRTVLEWFCYLYTLLGAMRWVPDWVGKRTFRFEWLPWMGMGILLLMAFAQEWRICRLKKALNLALDASYSLFNDLAASGAERLKQLLTGRAQDPATALNAFHALLDEMADARPEQRAKIVALKEQITRAIFER